MTVVKSPSVSGSVNTDFELQPILRGQLSTRRYSTYTACDGAMYAAGTTIGIVMVFTAAQVQSPYKAAYIACAIIVALGQVWGLFKSSGLRLTGQHHPYAYHPIDILIYTIAIIAGAIGIGLAFSRAIPTTKNRDDPCS